MANVNNNIKSKVCTKCGKRKKLELFEQYTVATGTGYRSSCTICFRKQCKIRRQLMDRGKYLADQQAYREAHRDELSAKSRDYYAAHKEHGQAVRRAYQKANKEKRQAYNKRWYEMNKERYQAESRVACEALADSYIKRALCHRSLLVHNDIPQELVEVKRAHMRLNRSLKKAK